MTIKLKEFGLIPYMIGTNSKNREISFLKKYTNCRIIKKNFSEIKENEYDILMVNSDQTWRKLNKKHFHFHDIAFLKFAKNWNVTKFIYGASLGYSEWKLSKEDEKIAKDLLSNFSDISVRERGSVDLVKIHLGIRPKFVLDPTLLIDKKYYLKIIKNFKCKSMIERKYIFTYLLKEENNTNNFIKDASNQLQYEIHNVTLGEKHSVEKFIYGIINSKAVITNSYHGTVFSIIFNKPFISFIFKKSARERLISLKETLKIKNRIFEYNQYPDINLLTIPLKINRNLLNSLKIQSINFLKKNLGIR